MTTTQSAIAYYGTSYPQRTPYVSIAEVYNNPSSLDYSNLISGGATAQQSVLTEVIGRASSWIDSYTCGAWGTLCATQNAENGRVWGSRDGTLRVHPKYWPIISVDAFSYSALGYGLPSNAASITPSGNIWIEPQEFIVTPQGVVNWGLNAPAGITTSPYYVNFLYSNGWPNTLLSASVAAGATSITPSIVTGILPGTILTIYDVPNDESIQVANTYVPGSATVPLTSELQYNHGTTVTVTNLPPAVKEACLLLVGALIKQRGSGSLIVEDLGPATRLDTSGIQGEGGDIGIAAELLSPYRMMFVGY